MMNIQFFKLIHTNLAGEKHISPIAVVSSSVINVSNFIIPDKYSNVNLTGDLIPITPADLKSEFMNHNNHVINLTIIDLDEQ